MDIDNLTLGQIKQLQTLFSAKDINVSNDGLQSLVGKKVIVRTYSCGVHYGLLAEKCGSEVILENSRMLYYWKTTNGGISLGEIANSGVHKDSKLCEPVSKQWLQAIGIIPCTEKAIKIIEEKDVYRA